MSGANAGPQTANPAPSDYQVIRELMKKMGARSFDPIPPDQHAAMMGADQPPFVRYWGSFLHHTIHFGHRSAYATSKDGHALTPEQIGAFVKIEEGNARQHFRAGVERGLWRNGTKEEGPRRCYLRGKVPSLKKGEDTAKEKVCTDLFESFPPYQREAIKALSEEARAEFAARAARIETRGKSVLAELMAAGREVIGRDYDTLFRDFGILKIRETHTKKSLTPEEVQALKARQQRVARLVPVVEQFVLTFDHSVQSAELAVYSEENEAVQTPSTLLPSDFGEKYSEGGRHSPMASQSPGETPPKNEESPINQHPAPAARDTRSRDARKLVAQRTQAKRKNEREVLPAAEPANAGEAGAVDSLFTHLEHMQTAYPHTDFSREQVSRANAGDRATVLEIVKKINLDVVGFIVFVVGKFKGLDRNALGKLPPRSPDAPHGPRSLGLILQWAGDYAAARRPATHGAGGES